MKISKINSDISFSGIRLSSSNIASTRRIVRYLRINGYECVGEKTYYLYKNNFLGKYEKTNYIRNKCSFDDNEFGVVIFPWSNETYFISEPRNEQSLLEWVNEMDPEAKINLLL